jgi:hypothetical protein
VHRDAAAVHTLHRRDQARPTGSHARVRRRSQALPAVEPRAIPALWNGGKRGPPAQAMIASGRRNSTPSRSTSARRRPSASREMFASGQRSSAVAQTSTSEDETKKCGRLDILRPAETGQGSGRAERGRGRHRETPLSASPDAGGVTVDRSRFWCRRTGHSTSPASLLPSDGR